MQKLFDRTKWPVVTKRKLFLVVFSVLVLVIGIGVGALGYKYYSSCRIKFLYINSNLGCMVQTGFDKSNPIVLKDKLTSYIASEKNKGDISEMSIYFRDLNDGPTLGIDEDDLFISASLLKLPIALTYYKLSEDEMSGILDQKLGFQITNGQDELQQHFKPSKTIDPASIYVVSELIKYSLIYSDNLANDVLRTYLENVGTKQNLVLRTFKELGLVEPTSIVTSDISTRAYASIFRQLYNASYLSNEDSEKVLSILSQSEFDQGIAAGVPKNIAVANKFGERDLTTQNQKQLHDCGIVYYPKNPYLICIMTRGKDYTVLANSIKEVSKIVYDEMYTRDTSR